MIHPGLFGPNGPMEKFFALLKQQGEDGFVATGVLAFLEAIKTKRLTPDEVCSQIEAAGFSRIHFKEFIEGLLHEESGTPSRQTTTRH